MSPATGVPEHDVAFCLVAVHDGRGRLLMQERDEHAPTSANLWCLPGGGTEPGESPAETAARELAEETSLVGVPLQEVARLRMFRPERGWFTFAVFAATEPVDPARVVCGEGRQMVFTPTEQVAALDLAHSTVLALAAVLPGWREQRFAGVLLVDPRGWLLLQERDEHPVLDPEKWAAPGGHVDPGEAYEAAAYRELEEETGVRAAPGSLALWGEFVLDHRVLGRWGVMQFFVGTTTCQQAQIECHEGRQIVFVPPDSVLARDLAPSARAFLEAFLESPEYATMAP